MIQHEILSLKLHANGDVELHSAPVASHNPHEHRNLPPHAEPRRDARTIVVLSKPRQRSTGVRIGPQADDVVTEAVGTRINVPRSHVSKRPIARVCRRLLESSSIGSACLRMDLRCDPRGGNGMLEVSVKLL